MAAPSTTKDFTSFSERINRIEISATLAIVNEAERLRASGADLVDLGAGEPHFTPPLHVKEAAIAAINGNFSRYTAVSGTAELRDAVAARHAADFGSKYGRDEVIAATGGKQALFNVFQVLLNHGDEVIIPVPYWVSFKDIVRYAGGVPVFVQSDESQGFAITAEMIERAVTPRTKVILLNSPSNPAGAVMKPEDERAIVELAIRKNLWIVSDECYVYLNYTGVRSSLGSLTEAKDRLVVIGSLSKTYAMTGWRLGYALGPKPLIGAMTKLQSQSTSNPTSIIQKASVAALTGPQQCLDDMLVEYRTLRDRCVERLRAIPGVQCQRPEGAFYAYPNVGSYVGKAGINSTAELAGRLLRDAGVVVVPGEAFGTKEHIRLSYATSAEALDRGLDRISKFLASL